VENGVGKPAASERRAPNAGSGKRAWRTPIPHLSRFGRKAEPGLIVFGKRESGSSSSASIKLKDENKDDDEDDLKQKKPPLKIFNGGFAFQKTYAM
jgi:hypothetical protein